jgi:hypothetical protein
MFSSHQPGTLRNAHHAAELSAQGREATRLLVVQSVAQPRVAMWKRAAAGKSPEGGISPRGRMGFCKTAKLHGKEGDDSSYAELSGLDMHVPPSDEVAKQ